MIKWETFCDECYYHMWRVRRKDERHFDEGFHVNNREEAQALVELLNGLERERDEARALADRLAALVSKPASEWGWEKVDALTALQEAGRIIKAMDHFEAEFSID